MADSEKQSVQQARVTIPITGMSCAACAARVEKGLSSLAGVSSANVNLVMEKAELTHEIAF